MIRLGLRLTLNGGREAVVRLILTTFGVALGVAMLLLTLAGINAVNSQNARYAWLETGAPADRASTGSVDPLWWLLNADTFQGDVIGRVDVAATGPRSPVPPGLAALPGPGQYYVSPALSRRLAAVPADQLADRFPGRQVGTIAAAGLPSPDSLVVVIGHRPAELAQVDGAVQVARISTTNPSSCNGACYFVGIDASGIDLVLSVTVAALLFPVLIFIGTASRLSAARREQRFAAMRLVGATPGQIAVLSSVESGCAAGLGVLIGFAAFWFARGPLAQIPFTGTRFFAGDLSLQANQVLVVALGVPIAATIAARVALRRVQISPLGVTRRVTPPPPRAWRLLPLLAGLAELGWFVLVGRPGSTPGQIQAYTSGILAVMVGLVVAGPWLTMVGARLVLRRTGRPAALIAARRLADDPKAGFRAISGLVLAIFVSSVAVGIIGTIDAYESGPRVDPASTSTLITDFSRYTDPSAPQSSIPAVSPALLNRLQNQPGVAAIVLIHEEVSFTPRFPPGVIACSDLARAPVLGHCPAGAQVVHIEPFFAGRYHSDESTIWLPDPRADVAQLPGLPVQKLVVVTNGAPATLERVRTLIENSYPLSYFATTVAESGEQDHNVQLDRQYKQLADVVILASLPIAGCGLAVSVVGGVNDRRRPFSLLRLAGAPIGTLRRVIAMESAVPLLSMTMMSIVIGFGTALLFLRSQLNETLQLPSAGYYVLLTAGVALSLAIICSTMPVLRRLTAPETFRNE